LVEGQGGRLSSGCIGDDRNVIRRSFAIALLAGLVACSTTDSASSVVSFPRNGGQATEISVRVADSADEREHGLMDVSELADDTGMAFVWDEPTTGTFWMKDTRIPLSIAFVDADGLIVTIRDMQPCTAEPCPTYGAASAYVLAIEANLGFYAQNDIHVGDRAVLKGGF
jgi:uncharacterized membrane protein (UPF0127 family)